MPPPRRPPGMRLIASSEAQIGRQAGGYDPRPRPVGFDPRPPTNKLGSEPHEINS